MKQEKCRMAIFYRGFDTLWCTKILKLDAYQRHHNYLLKALFFIHIMALEPPLRHKGDTQGGVFDEAEAGRCTFRWPYALPQKVS